MNLIKIIALQSTMEVVRISTAAGELPPLALTGKSPDSGTGIETRLKRIDHQFAGCDEGSRSELMASASFSRNRRKTEQRDPEREDTLPSHPSSHPSLLSTSQRTMYTPWTCTTTFQSILSDPNTNNAVSDTDKSTHSDQGACSGSGTERTPPHVPRILSELTGDREDTDQPPSPADTSPQKSPRRIRRDGADSAGTPMSPLHLHPGDVTGRSHSEKTEDNDSNASEPSSSGDGRSAASGHRKCDDVFPSAFRALLLCLPIALFLIGVFGVCVIYKTRK